MLYPLSYGGTLDSYGILLLTTVYGGCIMERKQIRLDEQADRDTSLIQTYYGLRSRSAAIRFALREIARLIEADKVKNGTPIQSSSTT